MNVSTKEITLNKYTTESEGKCIKNLAIKNMWVCAGVCDTHVYVGNKCNPAATLFIYIQLYFEARVRKERKR